MVNWAEWKEKPCCKSSHGKKDHKDSYTLSDILCNEFTQIINELASELIPTKKACMHSKAYMTPEIRTLISKCKESRRQYNKQRDPHNWGLLQRDLENLITKYAKSRQEWWDNKCQSLKSSDKKSWRTIHKILGGGTSAPVQPLVRNDKQYDFDDATIAQRLENVHVLHKHVDQNSFDENWKEAIQRTIEDIDYDNDIDNDNDLPENSNLTMDEVKHSLECLKSKDCPGLDTVHPKFIYECGTDIVGPLHFLFQACWQDGNVPPIWKNDNRIYILKPGKES